MTMEAPDKSKPITLTVDLTRVLLAAALLIATLALVLAIIALALV